MIEYRRLTTKDEEGNWQVWEDDYSHPFEALQVAIERLAELEDKIEKGTLVDTSAFYIDKGEKYGSSFPFVICKDFVETGIHDFCFTREEAEKRLKELQE